jgi:RNA polymerase subunit RPABC4/transcription elongation factor Spt4
MLDPLLLLYSRGLMNDNIGNYKLCFQCHAKIDISATACHHCGTRVEKDDVITASGTFTFINCKSCGVPIPKEHSHCPHCKKRKTRMLLGLVAVIGAGLIAYLVYL